VLAADHVAGSGAELIGVALAGVLVGALGVPWSISILGLLVAVTALLVYQDAQREHTPATPPQPAVVEVAGGGSADP